MDIKDNAYTVIYELSEVFKKIDSSGIDEFCSLIKNHKRIFTIGVGREGLSTKAFAMRLTHMGKESHWIWDDTTPGIKKGDLLVATTGSGEIGHIDYVVNRAREAGADIVIVTGSPSGFTASNSEHVLFIPASVYHGKDEVVKSIQPMGNLFEQALLIAFDLIIMKIVTEDNISFKQMSDRHRNVE